MVIGEKIRDQFAIYDSSDAFFNAKEIKFLFVVRAQ